MMKNSTLFNRIKPLILSAFLVFLDQFSKLWVIKNVPVNSLYKSYMNDFLWVVHVRNTGAAFSIGSGASVFLRIVLFVVVPVLFMVLIAYAVVTEKKFLTSAQRWFAAGILGGGIGTIIDRVFRFNEGVVDFISVKFYGILGMDRWPTFNVSDSCVVVFVILFAISVFFTKETSDANSKT